MTSCVTREQDEGRNQLLAKKTHYEVDKHRGNELKKLNWKNLIARLGIIG